MISMDDKAQVLLGVPATTHQGRVFMRMDQIVEQPKHEFIGEFGNHVIVPGGAEANGVGEIPGDFGRIAVGPAPSIGRTATVIRVSTTAIKHRRMNLGDAHHISSEGFSHSLARAGHSLRNSFSRSEISS